MNILTNVKQKYKNLINDIPFKIHELELNLLFYKSIVLKYILSKNIVLVLQK